MKTLLCSLVIVALTLAAHYAVLEINRANMRADLMAAANKVLEEQIFDMESTLADFRSQKTYEDGVMDGVELGENAMYTKGYHLGIQHGIDHERAGEYSLVKSK